MAHDERAISVLETFRDGRSINQFARDIGVDPAQLWRVLNGEQGADRVLLQLIRTYPERANEIAKGIKAQPETAVA